MKNFLLFLLLLLCPYVVQAQNVTIKAEKQPAAAVFRSIVEQTGKNFVYASDLLKEMKITVNADNRPLKKVLDDIFKDTDIEYQIKGSNVILKRRKKSQPKKINNSDISRATIKTKAIPTDSVTFLDEIVVVSRLENPTTETTEIGAKKVTGEEVRNIPSMFGESDVIKAIQLQPGVTDGTEGLAGMHVHGGNYDENLFSLDNLPLYQVNHFAGLFSAFNTDLIRYIDFYKTSVPAKYDGRLSSFLDVRLKNGSRNGHHGTARLGLTSGAFNISGPIGRKTTYLVGIRRSWYDLLTMPIIALINSKFEELNGKMRFQYAFMDFNAKINHRLSPKMTLSLSAYYGNDLLKTGSEDNTEYTTGWYEKDRYDFNWGNLLVQAGMNYRLSPKITAEFNAAFTRYFSSIKHSDFYQEFNLETHVINHTHNQISDWVFRGDFDWIPTENSRVRFGGGYIRHNFTPERVYRYYRVNTAEITSKETVSSYGGNEFDAYIEDEWKISDRFRLNGGLHGSLFHITGKTRANISPRLSVGWNINNNFALKGAFAHTVQYVHQLSMTYLSLPTDQWIPITGNFKPQTADKVSAGFYWQSNDGMFEASVEGYFKKMHNLLDYRDEYYLKPPLDYWETRLTPGKGTAKGIDFMIEKKSGRFTGHIAYSLAWADRQFKDKNGGHRYPARFDNRHTINVTLNWNINNKVILNAAWTGHSGNRYTFLPQQWEEPEFDGGYQWDDDVPLKAPINNYQLPFYHRLDLSCNVRNKRGFWTFSLYNAYNHMNTIGISRGYKDKMEYVDGGIYSTSIPVFKKIKLLPIIPSISYTWEF